MKKQRYFFCFQFPTLKNPPINNYDNYTGKLIATLAISPEQAANNAIYSTFHPTEGDKFKLVTKYLHETFDISSFVLNIDKLDDPIIQPELFGGQKSSHKRLDEGRLTKKIAERFSISTEGEDSLPREIARNYIKYRRRNPV
jgi:hypothetical protein